MENFDDFYKQLRKIKESDLEKLVEYGGNGEVFVKRPFFTGKNYNIAFAVRNSNYYVSTSRVQSVIYLLDLTNQFIYGNARQMPEVTILRIFKGTTGGVIAQECKEQALRILKEKYEIAKEEKPVLSPARSITKNRYLEPENSN